MDGEFRAIAKKRRRRAMREHQDRLAADSVCGGCRCREWRRGGSAGRGTCMLRSGIVLRDNVVLEGRGQQRTLLRYSQNYPLRAESLQRIAVRNLTLANAGSATEGPLIKNSRMVVLQNVTMTSGQSGNPSSMATTTFGYPDAYSTRKAPSTSNRPICSAERED